MTPYLTVEQESAREFHIGEVREKNLLEKDLPIHIAVAKVKSCDIADNPVLRLSS